MWGLEWEIWAMIGVAVLWISLVSIILRLYFIVRTLNNKKSRRDSEEQDLRIEKLKRELTLG